MATVTKKSFGQRQFGGAAGAYGNTTNLRFQLKTGATGGALDADVTTALAIGDVVRLGILPEGMRLDDASLFVTAGMTATITGKLGFAYVDGVDSAAVPQDDAYFGTGIDLAATGRKRATGSKLVTLPKPAYLILTTAVAANAKASHIDVVVTGELKGDQ